MAAALDLVDECQASCWVANNLFYGGIDALTGMGMGQGPEDDLRVRRYLAAVLDTRNVR